MKKVLLVTDVNFWEGSSGHRMRIAALIEFLAANVQLTVVNTGPAPVGIEATLNNKYHAEFFVLENNKYLNSTGYGRRLKTFLKGRHFDTVIIEYIHSSYFLNFLVEDAQVILDAHDIISNRADEFKRFNYAGALYELSRETETEILNVYDKIMVLCQADYVEITAMTDACKALLCPHPVQTRRHPTRDEVKNIAFIASAYLPNRDAIKWFINECWPGISAKHDVQLSIYGTVGNGLIIPQGQQIAVHGFVADINQIYADADIIINPVRFGAGVKIKNIEALANGLPLVTTSHGARGIEAGINRAFLVADRAAEFVEGTGSLIENTTLRNNLQEKALMYIAEEFCAEKCFEPLLKAINE